MSGAVGKSAGRVRRVWIFNPTQFRTQPHLSETRESRPRPLRPQDPAVQALGPSSLRPGGPGLALGVWLWAKQIQPLGHGTCGERDKTPTVHYL